MSTIQAVAGTKMILDNSQFVGSSWFQIYRQLNKSGEGNRGDSIYFSRKVTNIFPSHFEIEIPDEPKPTIVEIEPEIEQAPIEIPDAQVEAPQPEVISIPEETGSNQQPEEQTE